MASLQDIADRLGVARSTVSRALSGKGGISAKRRAEIQRLADELGVYPNLHAQALRRGRIRGVALMLPVVSSEISRIRNDFLLQRCQESFANVRVISVLTSKELPRLLDQVLAEGYESILISGLGIEIDDALVTRLGAASVAVCTLDTAHEAFDAVVLDRAHGAWQAARMLVLSGCKHPVFAIRRDPACARYQGVCEALRQLEMDPEAYIYPLTGSTDYDGGAKVMQEILQRRPVDGIFFYSDIMAIGAMRVLHREGISVPSDVKVIGFDNIAVAEHLPVSLTTVGQPVLEPVDAAISQIKTRLEDPDLARQFCRFETGLIIRESAPVGSELSREEIFSPKET